MFTMPLEQMKLRSKECYPIAGGVITRVGYHPQFGRNIVLHFSKGGVTDASPVDPLWAFHAHLSHILAPKGTIVVAGQAIGPIAHGDNASGRKT
jgi:hypothetical protein